MLRSALYATGAAVLTLVLGLPLGIILLLSPATSAASCSAGQPTGTGPTTVSGVPTQYLPSYESAASDFQLGADGWAYLAALNDAESTFGTNNGPGTGVLSGSNSAGAAGPMQIGIGGAATDNWDTVVALIPPTVAGGVQPPSVYNEADAVYGAAALLQRWGAPGDWQGALKKWNNFAPEINQVNQLVAQYTSTPQGTGTPPQGSTTAPAAGITTTPPPAASAGGGGVDQTSAVSYLNGLAGVKAGFAVVTAGGQVLAQDNATVRVPGASITKAMLLVAYLDKVGGATLDPVAGAHLQAMIEQSSNPDGSWVYAQVGARAVQQVATAAGMTGFSIDTSDPVYTLGQSLVTALDFARLFARIDQLMPATNRGYGMGLLENISAGDHWGILDAGVGVSASKAGWKTEPGAGWVVNQAGQLQVQGQTAGIAIVSQGESSQATGEQVMQTVASDLLAGASQPSPTAGGQCAAVSGPTVPGAVAQIQPDGTAAIPAGAPTQVQEAIAAGNQIIHAFYSQERRPAMLSQVQDSYDCSGSTDFLLYNAGLSSPQVDVGAGTASDSSALESYGQPGPGQWITVYANPGHAFIEVAGLVMDTAWYGPVQPTSVPDSYPPGDPANGGPASGPRWQPASIIQAQVHGDASGWFDERHPPGL